MFKQLKTQLLSTSLLALGVLLLGVYYATRGRIVAAAVMITVACIYIIAVNLWFWHYVTDPIDALTRVARRIAEERMEEEARALGADAIVGVRFATSSIMQSAAEVMAYGTAVKFV